MRLLVREKCGIMKYVLWHFYHTYRCIFYVLFKFLYLHCLSPIAIPWVRFFALHKKEGVILKAYKWVALEVKWKVLFTENVGWSTLFMKPNHMTYPVRATIPLGLRCQRLKQAEAVNNLLLYKRSLFCLNCYASCCLI